MARILAARGAHVLATGRRAPSDLPPDFPEIDYVAADLGCARDVARLVTQARALGPLDLAVLNAGAGHYRPLAAETPGDIAHVLDVNLTACMALAHGLREVLAGGTLGLVGSVAHKGAAGMPVYAASKAALDGFGRALAEEWRGTTTVRVLHPGPVATGMSRRAGRTPDFADRLFLPVPMTARTMLHALERDGGRDRQKISFLQVGQYGLLQGWRR
jgi:NAD(P)-dependent dehydrogenase (short-subunit alcohol dehydrogenase family)